MLCGSLKVYAVLAVILSLFTFGVSGLLVAFLCLLCFCGGFFYVLYTRGEDKARELDLDFECLIRDHKFQPGLANFLRNTNRFSNNTTYEQINSMTHSVSLDLILEQILSFVIRDYVDSWYKNLTSDELFRESLKRTSRRTISAFSQCVRKVDWVPFVTRHVVDDFASHLRLYRMATERVAYHKEHDSGSRDNLESYFFDLELEMEKSLCRDLLSTTPHYENAYLHDLVDIILYLLMPSEDFRCRPLRFLVREVIVKRIMIPILDHFADPNNMNQLLVWLLSEVSPKPEDFILAVEHSRSQTEMEAILHAAREEIAQLRSKDSGGEQGEFIKQQLASLDYLESIVKRKLIRLSDSSVDCAIDARFSTLPSGEHSLEDSFVQLPIHVVLTNSVAVQYLCDYLVSVGGQNYIDCYLAIEGFKISVEHQLRSFANGESNNWEVCETIKEAAKFMYDQYLSQEAITRVPLREVVVNKFLSRIKNDEPSDAWFEQIQDEISEVLKNDDRFYPGFKKHELYEKMLLELGIIGSEDDRPDSQLSDVSSIQSENSHSSQAVVPEKIPEEVPLEYSDPLDSEPVTTAVVETLGIGQQGKQAFALYNVRVSRTVAERKVSGWNVLRRYSDFHTLHNLICQRYPKLASISFPGKKTFNNLDAHFLEKRTRALNSYMACVLHPSLSRQNLGLDRILFDFLSQKEYLGGKEPITKKVMSAMWDPIGRGMRAIGTAVTAVPDQVVGGVVRVGDGIGKAAKAVIRQPSSSNLRMPPSFDTDRVAAGISDEDTNENIPLRVLVLFVDEVFGVRARNAWFRRQLVALLRQIVTPLGTSINKRIVDVVHWLTSDQQVTLYLTAMRDSIWPDGQLAPPTSLRTDSFNEKTKLLARALMLSSLPDELRLILGTETTYSGIATICSALQNRHLNRRLLYVLLERLLITIFPNNRFESIFSQLHAKSPRSKRT